MGRHDRSSGRGFGRRRDDGGLCGQARGAGLTGRGEDAILRRLERPLGRRPLGAQQPADGQSGVSRLAGAGAHLHGRHRRRPDASRAQGGLPQQGSGDDRVHARALAPAARGEPGIHRLLPGSPRSHDRRPLPRREHLPGQEARSTAPRASAPPLQRPPRDGLQGRRGEGPHAVREGHAIAGW